MAVQDGFTHHTCVYSSDEEFLAMAVPFVEGALRRSEPVLVTTTSHNLALLDAALGADATRVDRAESLYFGRRPPQRVAAFHRWWRRRARGGGRPRILAEPIWPGRSAREQLAWRRMESGLNAVLAGTGIWMICPYDTRNAPAEIVAESLCTHPGAITGTEVSPSGGYVDPHEFALRCDAEPLDPPPPGAAAFAFDGALRPLRRFTEEQARACGLTGERAALTVTAVSEIAAHIRDHGHGDGRAAVRIWTRGGAVICELHEPGGRADDPFLGFRPPTLQARTGDGLWLARQVSEFLDIRDDAGGCAYRLQMAGARVFEAI
ncbi:sensor histidine kinase [Thermomonospora cellulosilytica]|uniref:Anti-sigma regulatory factor (Ser/Thr protein kinase) n=1 Tax=Thermomonospora cellulosilytica TaxID=1411118 RepID=A0A7W3RA80_9ACTN|nr:sensor histidine kinase [Thermomonospora cellulosilytica]MBA9006118.1 anti-sigma regulatory factor (Ser/Thr protein kinase) [Thermomonospora cellulosilytica]